MKEYCKECRIQEAWKLRIMAPGHRTSRRTIKAHEIASKSSELIFTMSSTFKNISNLLSSRASHSRSTSKDLPKNQSTTRIKEILTSLVESLKYCPEDPMAEDNATYQSLRSEFSAYNDGKKWFDALSRESATMAEVGISFRNIVL
jgi:hypothetical protein